MINECDGKPLKLVQLPNSGTFLPNLSQCATAPLFPRVVGGTKARPEDYTFPVLLGKNLNGRFFYGCGGSLINRKYVLTAAHCTRPDVVLVGDTDLTTDCDCRGQGPARICAAKPQRVKDFLRRIASSKVILNSA